MNHRTRIREVPDSYFGLVRRFPLRRIRTKAEYVAAMAVLDELLLRGDEALDAGEVDYGEALARFISEYEQQRNRSEARRVSPLGILKHLMENQGMNQAELGRALGSASAASMVLKGRRDLSKRQI